MDEKIISNAEELATAVVMQDAANLALISFSFCIPTIIQLAEQMSEKPPIGKNLMFDFAYKKLGEHFTDIRKHVAKEMAKELYTKQREVWQERDLIIGGDYG